MNKKFTFMVAALLAAGFSVNAQVTPVSFDDVKSGEYYHIFGDADSDGEITQSSEYFMGINVASTTISYPTTAATADDEVPTAAVSDAYLWKVEKETVGTKTYVSLINKQTGKYLAINPTAGSGAGALITSTNAYDNNPNLIVKFLLTSDGELAYKENATEITIGSSNVTLTDTGSKIALVKAENTTASVSDLKKLGTGVAFDLEGKLAGEELLSELSVVTITNAGTSTVVATAANQFLFQVGKAAVTEYDLSKTADLDKFKAAEFIVLTNESNVEDDADKGLGLTYAKVKGEKLFKAASTSTKLESGKYPVENAIFTAVENANAAGKYAIKHTSVYVPVENEAQKAFIWTVVTSSSDVYMGYGGSLDALKLTSSKNIAWGKFSLGTAVDVKSLVKGQWVVNILASEDQSSTVMKRIAYSTQVATGTAKAITASVEDTEKYKDGIYAQWIVSANADNTVTFKNRETGVSYDNVTLFKTPKANVYTTDNADLKDCFIELKTVENTTQFDGYLNLDKEGLDSEYTLSVDHGNAFEEIEAKVVASSGKITKTTDANAYPLTFKLAQSKTQVKANETKLDTVFVNTVTYNYYKDGKLTEAKDTLKAISYNFASLKNAGKDAAGNAYDRVDAAFDLKNANDAGKFMFRKVGERYQIIEAADDSKYADNKYIQYVDAGNDFQKTASVEDAAAFALNPVAIAPSYEMPESHVAFEINGAYLGVKADGNAIMTNDTSMLKSTAVDASFSFYAFSADKEEAKTPSYYLSSNGMMLYNTSDSIKKIDDAIADLSPIFDAEEIAELKAEKEQYYKDSKQLVKFQQAKYANAEEIAVASGAINGDALKPFKFNVFDVDGQAVLKSVNGGYVTVLNDVVVLDSNSTTAAKFNVVAAEAPTSNEGVSATEVSVVANNGSIVVKNAAGKNVVVSTILGQVVANEVLTSDNATINVPAGIVVVAVEGESFKVNVK